MNSTTNNIPSATQETFNSVFLDMIKGARGAGHDVFAGGKLVASDVYGAGKATIVKAVDFAQEQAPLVVQEFLTWRFSQAIITLVFSLLILLAFGWLVKKSIDFVRQAPDDVDHFFCGVLGTIIAGAIFLVVMINATVPAVETIVKVKVAPRIYLIEWTTDQIKEMNASSKTK